MNEEFRSFQGGTPLLLTEPTPEQQEEEEEESNVSGWDSTAKVKKKVAAVAEKAKDFVASSRHWISESAQTQFDTIKVKTWNEHKPSWRRRDEDDDNNNIGGNVNHAPFPETLDAAMDEVKEITDTRAPETGAPLGGPPVPDVTERSRL